MTTKPRARPPRKVTMPPVPAVDQRILTIHLPADTAFVVAVLDAAGRHRPGARVAEVEEGAHGPQVAVLAPNLARVGADPPEECLGCGATLGTWQLANVHQCPDPE